MSCNVSKILQLRIFLEQLLIHLLKTNFCFVLFKILRQFTQYRIDRVTEGDAASPWRNTDNAQLLFGADLNGTTVGLAWVGGMCNRFSVGLVQVIMHNLFLSIKSKK